jgi:hypothetical protein
MLVFISDLEPRALGFCLGTMMELKIPHGKARGILAPRKRVLLTGIYTVVYRSLLRKLYRMV